MIATQGPWMAVYCCSETNSAGNLKLSPEIKGKPPITPSAGESWTCFTLLPHSGCMRVKCSYKWKIVPTTHKTSLPKNWINFLILGIINLNFLIIGKNFLILLLPLFLILPCSVGLSCGSFSTGGVKTPQK